MIASTAKRLLALFILLIVVSPAFALVTNGISVKTSSGKHDLTVEWAVTPAERERGLMERKVMPEDHGMIFDFDTEQPVYFWMKDTPMSLDMVFIKADGTVSRIERRATPFSEAVIPGGQPVRYVLELVGGAAEHFAIAEGDHFEISPPH